MIKGYTNALPHAILDFPHPLKLGKEVLQGPKQHLDQPNSHSDQIPYRKGHQLHGNSQPSTSSAYILK